MSELHWVCDTCSDEFTTTPTRHDPTTCKCGEAFVDHEDYGLRHTPAAIQVNASPD